MKLFTRRCFTLVVVVEALIVFVFGYARLKWFQAPPEPDKPTEKRQHQFAGGSRGLVEAVAHLASPDRYIILATVDEAFTDMAVNLYLMSFKPNKIQNFLFVGTGENACKLLSQAVESALSSQSSSSSLLSAGLSSSLRSSASLSWQLSSNAVVYLPCVHYTNTPDAGCRSAWRSPSFNRKMNIRSDMILDVLAAGYTVLHMDIDIFFFTNPLSHVKKALKGADIVALWDSPTYNEGFIAIKPTYNSLSVYQRVKKLTTHSNNTDYQTALNMAIDQLTNITKNRIDPLKVKRLDQARFLCGKTYFETEKRWYPKQEERHWLNRTEVESDRLQDFTNVRPVVVHNNWIVSYEAKVYRFKEHHMWMIDKDGYYSNATQRYLTYDIIKGSCGRVGRYPSEAAYERTGYQTQIKALRVALSLGHILNRVVILPRFYCLQNAAEKKKTSAHVYHCPLNALINIEQFDSVFSGQYRESSFLTHPLVPLSIKLNPSHNETHSPLRYFIRYASLDTDYVLDLLGESPDEVLDLQFHCHASGHRLLKDSAADAFDRRLDVALQQSNYRQLPSLLRRRGAVRFLRVGGVVVQ